MKREVNIKKKAIYIFILIISLTLFGCSNKINIETSVKVDEKQTIICTLKGDENQTKNFQGYINILTKIKDSEAESLKKVIVKDIKFSVNENGIPIMYKYNNVFSENDVQVIYDETRKGNIYSTYEYMPNEFKNYGFEKTNADEYTTKLQYLVMKVEFNPNHKEYKREVTLTMVYEFKNGSKIEKPIKVNILE